MWLRGHRFWGKRGCSLSFILNCFVYTHRCIIEEVRHKISLSIIFPEVFRRRLLLFCRYYFFCNAPSSSPEKSPSLISSYSLITFVSFSLISGGFLSRFLKSSFHYGSLSFWLAALSFAIREYFLPLTSFTVFHANCDCLL